jgi:hypothetical protein
MESPYQKDWRLQDVIAAIQVMGSSAWVVKRIEDWTDSLGNPQSAEKWEAVLTEHPEFFTVRIAPWISAANVRFPLLIGKLRKAQDSVSHFLQAQFSRRTQELLDSYDGSSNPSDELKTALAKELNSVIRRLEFYGEEPFSECPLPSYTAKLLEQLPLLDARRIRNRLILEAEYPMEITKEDFEPRASLIWRSSYDKNYDADQWRELTSEEVQRLPLEERDRLSRRPLNAEQIHALVTTALEMHTHVLAQQQEFRELRTEVRADQQEAREERAQQLQGVQALLGEVRAAREEARAVKQARLWWIPLATAVLSFIGVIVGAILGAALKAK